MNPGNLTRREAIARITLLMGGAMIGGDALLRGGVIETKAYDPDFSGAAIALLDEIGDTIIPPTATPGAKAARVGAFMAMMVRECYDDLHHHAFAKGLESIEALSRERFGKAFSNATAAQRTTLLNELDREQRAHEACREEGRPAHYFRMMKQLTLLGYFTSEIGATQALRYIEVPGSFDGDVAYTKGDRAWFSGPNRRL